MKNMINQMTIYVDGTWLEGIVIEGDKALVMGKGTLDRGKRGGLLAD